MVDMEIALCKMPRSNIETYIFHSAFRGVTFDLKLQWLSYNWIRSTIYLLSKDIVAKGQIKMHCFILETDLMSADSANSCTLSYYRVCIQTVGS